MNQALIAFMLPINADQDDVEQVVQSIYDHFKVERSAGGVDPATLASGGTTNEDGGDEEEEEEETIELDINGIPWDHRIHAGTRTKNKDGSWKKLKGVDDATVKRVTKALLKTVAEREAAAPQTQPPAPPAAAGSKLPPPPSSLPPPPAPKNKVYTDFVQFITSKHADQGGAITDEWLSQVLTHYGVGDGTLQSAVHLSDDKLNEVRAWIESVI